MKTRLLHASFFLTVIYTFSLGSCDTAPKGDNATITEKQKVSNAPGMTFILDTSTSEVRFTGYGVGKNHPGKFRVSSGKVTVDNNTISGGSFVIDIRSLQMEQPGEAYQTKLRGHLLSGDFFDADKFGTAKFEITGVEPYKPGSKDTSLVEGANFNVSGNLTLKGETRNITFPARIDLDKDVLKGKANFDIDRTQWKMNYGNDKTLGDKFISEKVNIKFNIEAKKGDVTANSK